jgi:tetratricopeptide (TPR) repeat protein
MQPCNILTVKCASSLHAFSNLNNIEVNRMLEKDGNFFPQNSPPMHLLRTFNGKMQINMVVASNWQLKNQGNELYRAGRFREALSKFDGAVSKSPDVAVYRANRAAALTSLGRLGEAIEESKVGLHFTVWHRILFSNQYLNHKCLFVPLVVSHPDLTPDERIETSQTTCAQRPPSASCKMLLLLLRFLLSIRSLSQDFQ